MNDDTEPTFSAQEAADAQMLLRQILGLEPEEFSVAAFIGMISDEIDELRAAGRDDAAIAEMLTDITGKKVSATLVTRFYATAEQGSRRDDL